MILGDLSSGRRVILHDNLDYESWMDDEDVAWINSFIGEGKDISPGCTVEGYIAVISYLDEDGNHRFHKYHTLDRPLPSLIGLLDTAKHEYLMENTVISPKQIREVDEDG